MLKPPADFRNMNEFYEQFKRKPAEQGNSNCQLAVSQAETAVANGNSQPASSQGENPSQEAAAGQTERQGRQFTERELEYFQRGYAMDEYGTMVPPESFKRQGEARLVERLGLPYNMDNEAAMRAWHKRQLKLLEKADAAPRCEHIFTEGTTCQSPRMRKHKYCYAHARMHEIRPQKLKLLPMEDENSIMLNIMEIQRALVDDEITEKRAGLLLYAQQLGLLAVRRVTFRTVDPGEMVKKMPRNIHHGDTEARRKEKLAADGRRGTQKNLTTDDTDSTDQNFKSKNLEPQRTQRDTRDTEEYRQEYRCHTSVEGAGASIEPEDMEGINPGDESAKSLFSGDEGGGGRHRRNRTESHPSKPKPVLPGTPEPHRDRA